MAGSIGRPREFDRDAALAAATLLFWRKGFAGTSMSDLCEAMGIRSPSLYAAFGSKEALYLEAMQHYVMTIGPRVWDALAVGATARAGVQNLLLAAAETLEESAVKPSGCMVMLAGVCDEWPAPIVEDVRKVRLQTLGVLRARLEVAVAEGELPSSADIDHLSRFYLGVVQGMAIQARDGATAAQLRGVAAAAMAAWPSGKTQSVNLC